MRVGVIGGGIQGICTALEFARRGARVDLFERHAQLMRGASRENEGKIHLGFVYANDSSLATSRLMCQAALTFAPLLRQYLERELPLDSCSDPFLYAVHVDSLLSTDELEGRYQRISRIIRTFAAIPGSDYFGVPRPDRFRRLTADELRDNFDACHIQGAFQTEELAIDPRQICHLLAARALDDPRIRIHKSCEVQSVEPGPRAVRIDFRESAASSVETSSSGDIEACIDGDLGGDRDLCVDRASSGDREWLDPSFAIAPTSIHEYHESFDHVVNCAWDGRLVLDRTAGVPIPRGWSFRRKYFLRVPAASLPVPIQSTTIVLGGFGDIVRYGNGGLFLSWYPVGCRALESGLKPLPDDLYRAADRTAMAAGILHGLRGVQRGIKQLDESSLTDAELTSGVIYALGETDVDDPHSPLHTRHRVGPRSFGRYHTVDTGKYTTAPLFAQSLAQSVCTLEKAA